MPVLDVASQKLIGHLTDSIALPEDLAPLSQVATLRSYINVAAVAGRSAGGPIGGVLLDSIGWRW